MLEVNGGVSNRSKHYNATNMVVCASQQQMRLSLLLS